MIIKLEFVILKLKIYYYLLFLLMIINGTKHSDFVKPECVAFNSGPFLYLRLHPEKLQEYMELKQDLAIQYPDERDRYSKEKEDFILQILFDAENEVIRKRPKKEI